MKRNQLKKLISEIIQQTFSEMNAQPQTSSYHDVADWELGRNDTAIFRGVVLPDGRVVDITVKFSGTWDDGAFTHAFGTQRYDLQFEVDQVKVISATDEAGTPLQLDSSIISAGESVFNDYEEKIVNIVSENPPEIDRPDPDDQRADDIERELGRHD